MSNYFSNLPRKTELNLKPYNVNYSELKYYDDSQEYFNKHGLFELIDLKNLSNASIKELTIRNDIKMNNMIKSELKELFNNKNITKLSIILISSEINSYFRYNNNSFNKYPLNKFLIFICKLLRKSYSIQVIELKFSFTFSLNSMQKKAFIFLIETIRNKLTKISNIDSIIKDSNLNSLLFSSSHLKEIIFDDKILYISEYSNIIGYIFSSVEYLDEFIIKNKINQQFFQDITESNKKVEINTLILENVSFQNYLSFIDNSYLFKIESLILKFSPKDIEAYSINLMQLLEHIIRLSNNPLNTVKRVIFTDSKIDYMASIYFMNFEKYNTKMIPRIFIEHYKEISLNPKDGNYKRFVLPYASDTNFELRIKNGFLDKNNFKELLYVLFILILILES